MGSTNGRPKTLFADGRSMDPNARQIALSVLQSLREDLICARLSNGNHIGSAADLRQYIYEQIQRIRTNAFAMDRLHGKDNRPEIRSKGNGHLEED